MASMRLYEDSLNGTGPGRRWHMYGSVPLHSICWGSTSLEDGPCTGRPPEYPARCIRENQLLCLVKERIAKIGTNGEYPCVNQQHAAAIVLAYLYILYACKASFISTLMLKPRRKRHNGHHFVCSKDHHLVYQRTWSYKTPLRNFWFTSASVKHKTREKQSRHP